MQFLHLFAFPPKLGEKISVGIDSRVVIPSSLLRYPNEKTKQTLSFCRFALCRNEKGKERAAIDRERARESDSDSMSKWTHFSWYASHSSILSPPCLPLMPLLLFFPFFSSSIDKNLTDWGLIEKE